MYRAADIKSLSNVMGWRQNFNTDNFAIDESLTQSLFGQYYQDVHPLVTLDNIKAIAPSFDEMSFPEWDVATTFEQGSKVQQGDLLYIALQNNIGQSPSDDDQSEPENWQLLDPFSSWLDTKTKAAVLNLVNDILNEKIVDDTHRNIIESKLLFTGSGNLKDTISNTQNLVGLELAPLKSIGATVKIDRIGLQFSGVAETIDLYLLHSSQKSFVKQITLERTKEGSLEWFTPTEDLYLPYLSPDSAGGSWFLVYDQRSLGSEVEAVSFDRDWSKSPCRCNPLDYNNYLVWSKFLTVHPFKTSDVVEPVGAPQMWDIDTNIYTPTTNYGLNLEVTVMCDTTDIILTQKKVFENAIGLQVACNMIREMAYNPEYNINRTQQNFSRQELLYELDGDSQSNKKSGLRYDLDLAKKAIRIDLNKMSKRCFTCKTGGIKIKRY